MGSNISWATALNTQQDDLQHMLAQHDVENQNLMKIAQQAEAQRQAREDERLRQAQIDEQATARAEATKQRADAQKTLDLERQAQADATRQKIADAADHQKRLQAIIDDPNADPLMKKAAMWEKADLKYKPSELQDAEAGQPVMRVNPRTGKVEQIGTAPKGSHFVNEPAPPAAPNLHFQVGLTPEGQPTTIAIDPKTGKVVNSNVTAAPPTMDARNRAAALEAAKPVFDKMDELVARINTHNGLYATAAGLAAKAAAKANLDNDVAEYNSVLKTYAPVILRAHGLLRPQNDQIKAFEDEAAVQPTDNYDLAQRKMRNLKTIGSKMAAAFLQQTPPGNVAPPPNGAAHDPLGLHE